jgi:hypothetical protein
LNAPSRGISRSVGSMCSSWSMEVLWDFGHHGPAAGR